MLTIEINSPELEKELQQYYGTNSQGIAKAFGDFLLEKRIQNDIQQSNQELQDGQEIALSDAFKIVKNTLYH